MQCRLNLNKGLGIELLFGNLNSYSYRNISDCYDLSDFKAEYTRSYALDFYEQFLQEETEEDAEEWCLKTLESEIMEFICEKYAEENRADEDDEDESDAGVDNSEANSFKTLEDFYEDYKYLETCISELKRYSQDVMHCVWEIQKNPKQTFKVGQDFSVVRSFMKLEARNEYKIEDFTFNLFPEMDSFSFSEWNNSGRYRYNTSAKFYISEISQFDSSSYKLELSTEAYGDYGDSKIRKLKFIVKEGDVLKFKYYEKDKIPYLAEATVEDIINNEMTLSFGLFKDIG